MGGISPWFYGECNDVHSHSWDRGNNKVQFGDFLKIGHINFRDQNCIEWSLYVPSREKPDNPLAFKLIHRIDDPQIREQWKPEAMISTAFTIEDEQDFQDFVIGAMAELCDPGTAPEDLTYTDVPELTQSLRKQIQEE